MAGAIKRSSRLRNGVHGGDGAVGTSRMLPVCELIHRVVPRARIIA